MTVEKYRARIRLRRKASAGLLVLSLLLLVCLFWVGTAENATGREAYVAGFQTGLCLVMAAVCVLNLWKTRRLLRDEEAFREAYVRETDERTCMIEDKSFSAGFRIVTVSLLLAAVVAGYFSLTVMHTLCGTLLFIGFVRLGLYGYYSHKY